MSTCYDLSPAELREAYSREPRFTTQKEFAEVLRELGIAPGIRLMVHSSLRSLGEFEGGAEGLCRTLQELVTEDGTLLMPGLSGYPRSGEPYCFDPEASRVAVGIVPDTFRKLPGVVRSWNPTHSICAWGRDKERFVRRHHLVPTMDPESPLGLLEQAGGHCLMIGCYTKVTFMHVVEMSCSAPCLGLRTEEYDGLLHGKPVRLRTWSWRNGECRALDSDRIFDYMRARGTVAERMLGHSHLVFFRLADYREAYASRLLDPATGCAHCAVRPREVAQTVSTDWDAARRQLRPDTPAYTGEWHA